MRATHQLTDYRTRERGGNEKSESVRSREKEERSDSELAIDVNDDLNQLNSSRRSLRSLDSVRRVEPRSLGVEKNERGADDGVEGEESWGDSNLDVERGGFIVGSLIHVKTRITEAKRGGKRDEREVNRRSTFNFVRVSTRESERKSERNELTSSKQVYHRAAVFLRPCTESAAKLRKQKELAQL